MGKRVRKYYKITNTGKKMVTEGKEEINDFIETLNIIFNPKSMAK